MNYDYCKGCETPYNCRWCPDNKSKDRCGFCGSEVPTEQAERIGRLWKEFTDTKKKLDDLSDKIGKLQSKLDIAVDALKKYKSDSGNWWYGYEFQGHYEDYAGEYADKALEQIIALEQKDVK